MNLYAAYGSNLNHEQMSRRCPKAKFIRSGKLLNHRLAFRQVADIEYAEGNYVPVGLWQVSSSCIKALDAYEGHPYLYRKEFIKVQSGNRDYKAFVYKMNDDDLYALPSARYLRGIMDGYVDCDLDLEKLTDALNLLHLFGNEPTDEDFMAALGPCGK